ncbi:5-oxoprolinase/urea amidolyase family protein [Arthrobacter sp. zg-Y820]|uniref:5-oxoprolinase subunit B/C family protein n=1 Tax=unclassified Arthrobacter TaxID=235627 RepID=UPI001E4374A9|nr:MULTISPECIES: 5-oxoprolinase/urea amidolyase family protein [unclassified Arthrobacter]MCC9195273.1 5-oxoprolinase/urea amidolyase family protein [Arthrobacter sp. zg-Y820]MDK1278132.1 5-oxoprolinase/urea amidolyase family protein [Arthrobacter sp. zg.Y820]WIB10021.1 5-oxoprolinase/urea amidolyase family protein [Arthrobacter sp. zg-Y820]
MTSSPIAGIRPAGTRTLLVELASLADVTALHTQLKAHPLPGQVDVLAAAGTVLVRFIGRRETVDAAGRIPALDLTHAEAPEARTVTIDTVYDGADLAEVARLTGLSEEAVVKAHTGSSWLGGFGGFAPGFTYLTGGDPALNVPRRDSPRTAVPAGSVALAGEYSAVYPRESPGGWQLIGRTNAVMWDLDRPDPALIRPGDRVIFQAVRELVTTTDPSPAAIEESATGPSLEVRAAGLQSLIQDLGRPGYADLGVSASGAADTRSARQANRLVGNPADAAVIENLFGGLELTAHGDTVLALAGAEVPAAVISPDGKRDRPVPLNAPFALLDGEILTLGSPFRGVRTYVGVRGGIAVEPVLGSCSTDSMSHIGPASLDAGTRLPIGNITGTAPVGSPEPGTLLSGDQPGTLGDGDSPALLRITAGPRQDWFGPDAAAALTEHTWRTTNESNRIGVRLETDPEDPEAQPLQRVRNGELPSEGVVAGSLQIPPSGLPVLFLADHPVTGGYPVIAAVVPEDLPVAAQLPPGHPVRFVFVNPDTLAPLSPGSAAALFPEGTP